MPYVSDFPLSDRLSDLMAYALISDRLSDDDVEWIQLALTLLDCVAAGYLQLRPRNVDER